MPWRRRKCTLLVILCLIVGSAVPTISADLVADPADWPMFQYNAQHTGYNDASTLKPPLEQLWLRNVFDSAFKLAPVAVADNRVLVTHNDWGSWSYSRERYARCLNGRNGVTLWDRGFGVSDWMYPPAFGYGFAFIQRENYAATISALTPGSGKTAWSFFYVEQGFLRQSPTIYRNRLLTSGNEYNGMICVNALTGEGLWGHDGAMYDLTEPSAWGNEVFIFSDGYFVVEDLESGENKWMLFVYDTLAIAKPANPQWFMGTATVIDTLHNIAILPWHVSLTAVDLGTHRILWQRWGDFGKSCMGISPALAEGQLLVVDSGMLKSFDVQTGEVRWRFDEDPAICYPPVAANGYVYVSGTDRVHVINLSTHQCEFEGQLGLTGWLSIARDRLYVATQIGLLACLQGAPNDVPDRPSLPEFFALEQNYPNPFNQATTISFYLPGRVTVKLTIHDILGREVRSLANESFSAGTHRLTWDGTNNQGRVAASGVYLYRLEAGDFAQTRKMLLLK